MVPAIDMLLNAYTDMRNPETGYNIQNCRQTTETDHPLLVSTAILFCLIAVFTQSLKEVWKSSKIYVQTWRVHVR